MFRASRMARSSTLFPRGLRGRSTGLFLGIPLPTTSSMRRRTSSSSTPKACSTWAATPSPSTSNPSRTCSVPMTSCPMLSASRWANCTTFFPRSVKNCHMDGFLLCPRNGCTSCAIFRNRTVNSPRGTLPADMSRINSGSNSSSTIRRTHSLQK